MEKPNSNRYALIIEQIFLDCYQDGMEVVPFERTEIEDKARTLGIRLPKNLGDVIYSFKYRVPLPESIVNRAPTDKVWVIVNRGRGKYAFEAKSAAYIQPDDMLVEIKILDATPGMVEKYATDDEQALLSKLRYNRLLDIFTGVACYSLQNHLRTSIPGIGQIETDEIYVGVDRQGTHYVFPVQAKGGRDEIGVVQIEQDIAMCRHKFPTLVCRPVAAQFMRDRVIALFELGLDSGEVKKIAEKHYRLTALENLTDEELLSYRQQSRIANT